MARKKWKGNYSFYVAPALRTNSNPDKSPSAGNIFSG
jgi:hypothetical protein